VSVIVEVGSIVEVEVPVDVVVVVVIFGEICKREEQKESAPIVACNELIMTLTAKRSRFDAV
jgi:hypothetical protein